MNNNTKNMDIITSINPSREKLYPNAEVSKVVLLRGTSISLNLPWSLWVGWISCPIITIRWIREKKIRDICKMVKIWSFLKEINQEVVNRTKRREDKRYTNHLSSIFLIESFKKISVSGSNVNSTNRLLVSSLPMMMEN